MCDPELKAELQALSRTVSSLSGNVSQLSHVLQELSDEVGTLSNRLSDEQIDRRDTDLELFKGLQQGQKAANDNGRAEPPKSDSDAPIRVEISFKRKALVAALVAALLAVWGSIVGLQ